MAVSGNEFSLIMGPGGVLLKMRGYEKNAIDHLLKEIDAAELAGKESPMWINGVLDQFPDALGAYQHMILLAPASSSIDLTKLASALADKRISLNAMIYGIGEFTDQLSRVSKTDRWITYEDFPIEGNEYERYAFSLQNELIDFYFANTPGLGIVDMQFGRLPAIDNSQFKFLSEDSDAGEDGHLAINIEQRAMGVDFPVWIEEGAQSVTFLLSQPKQDIAFSLIAPNGTQRKAIASSGPNVLSFDLSKRITGRWILRLQRIKAGDDLPFFLLSAVGNLAVATSSSVEVDGANVKFRFMSEHELPLDLVDTVVDIFRLLPDKQTPGPILKSIVLNRERALDRKTEKTVELSTGWVQGEIKLKPGAYMAIFRANHNGQAIYASNPEGNVGGNLVTHELRQIPPFSRRC